MMALQTQSPSFAGFKFSFAARTLNPQFKSYKSNFYFSSSEAGSWTTIAIPWLVSKRKRRKRRRRRRNYGRERERERERERDKIVA